MEQYGAQVDALVMHPRTLNRFRKLKDTTGNYFQNMNQGYNQPNPAAITQDLDQYQIGAPVAVICGKPVFTTDQVSTTLTVGAATTTSNVYAFDKESMAYSLKGGLIVEMSTEAGANTFLNHQAIIKVMMTGDAKVLRTQGVAKLTGCL